MATTATGPMTTGAMPDDRELVERLRAGDDEAYEDLVRRHGARMLAVARRILRDDDEAQDAVQDGFCAAFKSISGFTGSAMLSTWLHRIVVNACLMRLRTRRRRREDSIEDLLPSFLEDGHHASEVATWQVTAHDAVERAERGKVVRACIDELPESYRTILVLRDIEELDTREAAALLGITENAAKIRLHRARQAARTLLDRHFGPGASP